MVIFIYFIFLFILEIKDEKNEKENISESEEKEINDKKNIEMNEKSEIKEDKKEIEFIPNIKDETINLIKEYNNLIEEVLKIKDTGNGFYNKKNYEEAEKYYRQGIEKIEKFSPINQTDEYNSELEDCKYKIKSYKKILYSNISLSMSKRENYKEANEINLYILHNIDPDDESTYLRLLKYTLSLGDFEQGKKIYEDIKNKFSDNEEKFERIQNNCQDLIKSLKEYDEQIQRNFYYKLLNYTLTGIGIFTGVCLITYFAKKYYKSKY